jgi:hypothetical protein
MREPAAPGRNKTALSIRRSKSSFRFSYVEVNLLFFRNCRDEGAARFNFTRR